MRKAKNVSFDEQPIEITLNSHFVAFLDPLALDGMRRELESLIGLNEADRADAIRMMSGNLRIGVVVIEGFRPGQFRLAASDFEKPEPDDDNVASADVCDFDSGTIVVVDIGKIPELARILTWERYDWALQSPAGDDSRFLELTDELGGPYFGLISAVEGAPFDGDGTYTLRKGFPLRIGN